MGPIRNLFTLALVACLLTVGCASSSKGKSKDINEKMSSTVISMEDMEKKHSARVTQLSANAEERITTYNLYNKTKYQLSVSIRGSRYKQDHFIDPYGSKSGITVTHTGWIAVWGGTFEGQEQVGTYDYKVYEESTEIVNLNFN